MPTPHRNATWARFTAVCRIAFRPSSSSAALVVTTSTCSGTFSGSSIISKSSSSRALAETLSPDFRHFPNSTPSTSQSARPRAIRIRTISVTNTTPTQGAAAAMTSSSFPAATSLSPMTAVIPESTRLARAASRVALFSSAFHRRSACATR